MSITHPKAQRQGYHEPKASLDEVQGPISYKPI